MAVTKKPNILCVGRLYCDVIFTGLPRMPTPGTEVYADGVGLHAGGGAAITAGHLASLGHPTQLAAHFPAEAFGNVVKSELQELGIDLRLSSASDRVSDPQLTVALVHNGERAFVTRRTGPAFPKFSAASISRSGTKHIHVGEAATLVENPHLVDVARTAGATLSLDCSWDDDLDTGTLAALLPEIDVFLPNQAEIDLLRKRGVTQPFAKLTVVKQGVRGATALMDSGDVHAHPPTVDIVDTTGAGDAFNAAFLSAWLDQKTMHDCLAASNARGAKAVTYRGGLGGVVPATALEGTTG